MLNLIIADDEPLVCIGLQSMIPWARLNLKLAGTASNGQEALQLIKRLQPDIVISDIKMPVMDGLSIAREIRSQKLPQPQFIFITSYEDFHYVKDALQLEAVDYLLKMELTPASLEACLNRARERLNQQRQQKAWPASAAPDNWGNLREKFVLRLLYHLFPSKEQYEYQRQALNIHPDASTVYAAVSCWIDQPGVQAIDPHKLPDLYHACLQMASNCLKPRLNAIFCGLDLQSFAIVLLLNEAQQQQRQEQVCAALKQMGHVLHSYFNVRLTIVLGPQINDLYQINQSFIYARSYVPQDTAAAVTLIDIPARSPDQQPQDISAWREQLRRAFEELDAAALTELIDQLTLELRSDQIPLSSAVDLAAS
ncbi:MAG: response regulator, partial [Oscillospiraceae bacterium]|nr:response regulator [Oscillospiraceae bacterium]